MKKILLFLVLAPFLLSCEDQEPVDYAVISAKINNTQSEEVVIARIDRTFSKSIPLNENGTFTDTLQINEPGSYRIVEGGNGQLIYLDKGYNLEVKYDSQEPIHSVEFMGNGKGSEFNQYLVDKVKKQLEIRNADFEEFYGMEKDAFKNVVLEIKAAKEELLASVNTIPEELRAKEKRNIGYTSTIFLSTYNQVSINKTHFKPEEFNDVFEGYTELDYTNGEDLSYSFYYPGLVRRHYSKKANKLAGKENLNDDQAFYKMLKGIPGEKMRNFLLYNKASWEITSTEDLESYYKRFMELSTNDFHKEKITESYEKLKKLSPGQPSPKFVDYENHAGGKTSLDDLKGAYVYFDIWATWCGPCLNEIPALKKLAEEYKDSNIKFVSISVDQWQDYEKWKDMVVEKEMGGIQLMADNATSSEFFVDYQIQAIPRFILLDPEGNIVTSRAPYPSDENLIKLFEEQDI